MWWFIVPKAEPVVLRSPRTWLSVHVRIPVRLQVDTTRWLFERGARGVEESYPGVGTIGLDGPVVSGDPRDWGGDAPDNPSGEVMLTAWFEGEGAEAIPEALRSADPDRVLSTLEMLVAWERAIPLGDLDEVLLHRNREIRLCALRLATVTPATPSNRAAIVRLLVEEDLEVSIAAALTAGSGRVSTSSHTRFMASVTLSGSCRAKYSRSASR